MRKFKLWVSVGLAGCMIERTVDFDDEDVPEDWETDDDFQRDMHDMLADMGLMDWGYEEVDDA